MISFLFSRARRKRELDQEIRTHFEMAVRDRIARGESRSDAERAVRREFGNIDHVKEETRAVWGGVWLDRLTQDVRLALRTLRKNPGFAFSTLLILALGIGANTALFSVVKEVLLQGPPVAHADRLVTVYTTCRLGQPRCSSSYPDYVDYRDRSSALEDLAIAESMNVNLGEDGLAPSLAEATLISGNYFDVLGLGPYLGRLVQPVDDEVGAPRMVAVLSYAAWSVRFGADPSAIGRIIAVNGRPFEIIGVTPEGFRGTTLTDPPDVFIPVAAISRLQTPPGLAEVNQVAMQDQLQFQDQFLFATRNVRWMRRLVGRLAPGVMPDQARQELVAVSESMREEDPIARGPRSITLDPALHYTLPEDAHDALPQFVVLVSFVVGLILLLACANIANLLLARGAARLKEIAMRQALGASRQRVVGQLVTESIVIGLLGGAAGLALAPLLVRGLSQATLPGGVAVQHLDLGLDLSTLAFGLLLAVATSVTFGLIPALRAGRADLLSVVKGVGGHHSRRGNGLRKGLVAVQSGLCILLLVGAGLFLQTVRNGLSHDSGFDPDNLALLQFDLRPLGLSSAVALDGLERVQTRSNLLPAVRSTAVVTQAPLVSGGQGVFFEVPDYVPAADEELRLEWVAGTSGALSTFGIPIRAGADLAESSDRSVWINETMANRYFPEGALGRRVSMLDSEFTVAGVFADVDWDSIGEETINNAIVSLSTVADSRGAAAGPITLAVRFDGAASPLSALRDEVQAVFPDVTFLDAQTASDVVRSELAPQRLAASLLSGMGALALVLSALGIAGVVTYLVSQRRRDIGIQIALGASPGRVVGVLVREMAGPIFAGALVGAAASVAFGRVASSFLFGIAPGDPATLAACVLILSMIAMFAIFLPAQRASRIDPMVALREE